MSDDWDFYFARVNGAVSSIFVDLGVHQRFSARDGDHLIGIAT